jgi:2-polyprenyl-3-methyl-5-hydroxy-6-metoxy-1,4-benzoquinol methylase
MLAEDWDARYAAAQQWSDEPNALAGSLLAELPAGRALDVAAGEGRMALWLASHGWTVTALDFSAVGLQRGQQRAQERGLHVDWQVADATAAEFGDQAYDLVLVLVLYLHLSRQVLPEVLARCARAVAPGGLLMVIGHDRDNLEHGVGGPPDPNVLYDVELLRAAATGLEVQRAEQVDRQVGQEVAIDTLLLARRPTSS